MTIFESLPLQRGPALNNRLWLAPLTNSQSHADGRLSDTEKNWLLMRAHGGFAMTMTCAAHVQAEGVDFVLLGRAAILHHDFPLQARNDPYFQQIALPISRNYLKEQGLGEAFIDYMSGWPGFVS